MPQLRERFEEFGWLIKAVAGILALLPGVAILLGLVDIPPDLEDLINYISFSISIVTILAVMLLTPAIDKVRPSLAAVIIVVCAAAGAVSATSYRSFAQSHIVSIPVGEEVERHVIPLNPSAEIRQLMEPYSWDYVEALQTHVQRVRLKELMARDSGGSTARMILLLVLAQTLIVGAIVFGAWKLAGSGKKKVEA
ncbi:hypothetical protein [Allosphingosinicella sp.]|uniref:hypothetical protein n=1 Tax=Allosphingosinicella sp. TaxID=2823234 RepID=UPI002FC1BE9D